MEWFSSVLCILWLGVLTVEDWRTHTLPMYIIVIGTVLLAGLNLALIPITDMGIYIGGALWGSSFLILGLCTNQQLGYGDGLVLTSLGFYLGTWEFVKVISAAFFCCGIYIIVIKATRKLQEDIGIAFVPFIFLGYLIVESEGEVMRLRGSATVEALYIMPLIFLVFMVAVHLGFFFHDKSVLQGLVYEATVIGSSQYHNEGEINEEEIREFIEKQCMVKLLYFPIPQIEIMYSTKGMVVNAMTNSGIMEIEVEKVLPVTSPEEMIRRINLLEGEW